METLIKPELIMLRAILKYDYSLSKWWASSEERVMPGLTHLFLTKLSFTAVAFYCVLLKIIPFKLGKVVVVGIPMFLTLIIMYGLQKTVIRYVKEYKIEQEYKRLNLSERRIRNFLGVALLIIVFLGTFFVGVKTIGGYLK